MRSDKVYVTLVLGVARGTLCVLRAPRFLRFVAKGTDWKTLDVLDQLADVPAEGERVIVAERGERQVIHWDGRAKNGRRQSGWETSFTYTALADQPPQPVMRDTQNWRNWCLERQAAERVAAESNKG